MDFKGIHDRLRAIRAPGLVAADEPRKPNPADKKDKGRGGDPFVLVDPQLLPSFLQVCRDDPRLRFELLIDLTAADPSKDGADLWVCVQLLSLEHRHRLAIKCLLPKSKPVLPTSVPVHRSA